MPVSDFLRKNNFRLWREKNLLLSPGFDPVTSWLVNLAKTLPFRVRHNTFSYVTALSFAFDFLRVAHCLFRPRIAEKVRIPSYFFLKKKSNEEVPEFANPDEDMGVGDENDEKLLNKEDE